MGQVTHRPRPGGSPAPAARLAEQPPSEGQGDDPGAVEDHEQRRDSAPVVPISTPASGKARVTMARGRFRPARAPGSRSRHPGPRLLAVDRGGLSQRRLRTSSSSRRLQCWSRVRRLCHTGPVGDALEWRCSCPGAAQKFREISPSRSRRSSRAFVPERTLRDAAVRASLGLCAGQLHVLLAPLLGELVEAARRR